MIRSHWRTTSLFLAVAILAGECAAQSPAWRVDYNAARREAQDKKKPLLVDFVTDNCFWCKKLDTSTFSDPDIARLINEQFVPLKIDANKHADLVQKLEIHSYPTMLLAAPDGRVLTVIEGYLEPAKFIGHLNATVAACTPAGPDWMTRDYQESLLAAKAGDTARALTLLRGIARDGKDLPVQKQARERIEGIAAEGRKRLESATALADKGHWHDASTALTAIRAAYPKTEIETQAGELLARVSTRLHEERQRRRSPAEILVHAREELRAFHYSACLDKCDLLTGQHAGTPEAAEAAALSREIKANPEWMARACRSADEHLAQMYLTLGESWLARGNAVEATAAYQRVLQIAPGSRTATEAQARLASLVSRPGQRTNFKKP